MNRHLSTEKHGDFIVVHFVEKNIYADLAVGELGDELYEIVRHPDCLKVVLDFSNVELLSSVTLGKLLSVKKTMAEKGGLLRLCEICDTLRMAFTLTHLDHIFDIRNTVAEAVGP
jgi:anti-anti-sigma factor